MKTLPGPATNLQDSLSGFLQNEHWFSLELILLLATIYPQISTSSSSYHLLEGERRGLGGLGLHQLYRIPLPVPLKDNSLYRYRERFFRRTD